MGRDGATRGAGAAAPTLLAADRRATGRTAEARTAMADMVLKRRWKGGGGGELGWKRAVFRICEWPSIRLTFFFLFLTFFRDD